MKALGEKKVKKEEVNHRRSGRKRSSEDEDPGRKAKRRQQKKPTHHQQLSSPSPGSLQVCAVSMTPTGAASGSEGGGVASYRWQMDGVGGNWGSPGTGGGAGASCSSSSSSSSSSCAGASGLIRRATNSRITRMWEELEVHAEEDVVVLEGPVKDLHDWHSLFITNLNEVSIEVQDLYESSSSLPSAVSCNLDVIEWFLY